MLRFFDGFDWLGTSNGDVDAEFFRRYVALTAGSGIAANLIYIADGIYSGKALEFNTSNTFLRTYRLPVSGDTQVVGFAVKLTLNNRANGDRILSLYDGTTEGVGIYVLTGNELKVMRGGSTQLAATSGFGLANDVWYYLELKVKCAAGTGGTVELRSNGVSVASNAACLTKAGSNTYHDVVAVAGGPSMKRVIDDLYFLDTSGSVNNDFLGPVHVTRLDPISDNGTNQWTTQSGSNHAAMVDDGAAVDDDSTYVEDGTTGHAELWDYGDFVGGAIHGVNVVTEARLTDALDFTLKSTARLGAGTINKAAAVQVPGANYQLLTRLMETDPDGGAWTAVNLCNTAFGVEVG